MTVVVWIIAIVVMGVNCYFIIDKVVCVCPPVAVVQSMFTLVCCNWLRFCLLLRQ